jgi:hypothetical protein
VKSDGFLHSHIFCYIGICKMLCHLYEFDPLQWHKKIAALMGVCCMDGRDITSFLDVMVWEGGNFSPRSACRRLAPSIVLPFTSDDMHALSISDSKEKVATLPF